MVKESQKNLRYHHTLSILNSSSSILRNGFTVISKTSFYPSLDFVEVFLVGLGMELLLGV